MVHRLQDEYKKKSTGKELFDKCKAGGMESFSGVFYVVMLFSDEVRVDEFV